MINCIIIDDEEHAIEVTRSFCQKIPYLQIIGEFTDPIDATSFIDLRHNEIDLVFLDIEMPRFSGTDFLKAYTFPNVILVTAYTDYALNSHEYGVVDYLLKPFSFERFSIAVNKVYAIQQKNNDTSTDNNTIEESDALYLKLERNKYVKTAYADIKYIKGAQNYTVIRTASAEIVVPLRLKDLAERLPPNRFLRTHKSYIINMDYFESLVGNEIKINEMDGTVPLGAAYKADFIAFLQQQYNRNAR